MQRLVFNILGEFPRHPHLACAQAAADSAAAADPGPIGLQSDIAPAHAEDRLPGPHLVELHRLGINARARAHRKPREQRVADLLLHPAQLAQQRQIAKVEDVGDIDSFGHKARAEDLELGEVKPEGRQRFEPHKAHVLRRDAHIDDRLFVLAF